MENIFKNENGKMIIFILILGGFFCMLSETALNVAFPQIMTEYNITTNIVQWLTTIYVLVSGIVFLMTAYLIKKYSTRKLYLTAILLLIIGCAIAFVSINFPLLMIGRIIQAIGTGIIVPLVFNSVLYLTVPQKRGFMMGIVSLVVLSAPIFAPVVMGLIMEFTDWHFYFILMLIFFVAAFLLAYKKLENIKKTSKSKLDILSIIIATVGCFLIVWSFSNLAINSITITLITLILGAIAIGLFIYRQSHIEYPLLRIHVLKDKLFIIGILTNLFNVMFVFGIVILIPMYLEKGLGTSSLTASLVILPGTIIGSIIPLISGRIYDDYGPRVVICTGIAIMTIASFCLSTINFETSLIMLCIIIVFFYFGSSMALSPNQTNTLGNLTQNDYTSGSAIMTSTQQIGGAIGSSLFTSFLTIGQNNYLSTIVNPTSIQEAIGLVKGINFAFAIGTIMMAVIFVLTLFLKQKKEYKQS